MEIQFLKNYGKLIYTGGGNTRYPAAPAFYLVTVNKNVYKVVVR